MARYIDGTALLNKYNSRNMTANEMYQALVEQPTAEVAEVKHGEWMKNNIECSVCKEINPTLWLDNFDLKYKAKPLKFCPNCGAMMNGVKNDG